ncbi:TPA: hypothetical protein I7730_20400 [Vibrio vulnificus]|uniref:Uncharacterized protein n=1 Tax=Vibrio vulnificus TaxID=672 RepID=A0A8H9THC3_VIBVL|nr:hypothetical protein [Vibrio vulnificus]HAS8542153.1 hypothetical protein [Vibrio vulnificus]
MITLNENVLSLGGLDFAVGGKWEEGHLEAATSVRKLKLIKSMMQNSISTGVLVEGEAFAQVADYPSKMLGKYSLASYLYGSKNTAFFLEVGEDEYWVAVYDHNGLLSTHADVDTCISRNALRDFLSMQVNISEDPDAFRIVNLSHNEFKFAGERSLSDKLESVILSEGSIDRGRLAQCVIKKQVGDLNRKVVGGISLVALAVAAYGYYFVTTPPEVISDIQYGIYSNEFTEIHQELSSQFSEIQRAESARKTVNDESFVRKGKEEFNELILSKNVSNIEVLNSVAAFREMAPVKINGWDFQSLEYQNNRFFLTYKRAGLFPESSNYLEFDKAIAKYFKEKGVDVSPSSLLSKGGVRVSEIVVTKAQSPEYIKFLEDRRKINEARSGVISRISSLQIKLEQYQSLIDEAQMSVELLGPFEMRDETITSGIINKIDDIVMQAKPYLDSMKLELSGYKGIPQLSIPDHSSKLIGDSGIEGTIYPLLQNKNTFSWGEPSSKSGFPVSINDKRYEGKYVIQGSTFKLVMTNGISQLDNLHDIFNNEYVHIGDIKVTGKAGSEPKVEIDVNLYELNSDFIF